MPTSISSTPPKKVENYTFQSLLYIACTFEHYKTSIRTILFDAISILLDNK